MTRLFWWFTVPIFIIIISLKVTKCARNFLTLGTQFPRNHSESWCVYGRTVGRELVLKKLCSLALTRPCCKKLKEKEKKSYKKFMSRDELCVFMVLTGKDERKVFFVESSLWLSCSLSEPDGRIYLALSHGLRTSLRALWPWAKYFPLQPSHSVNTCILSKYSNQDR